MSEQGSDTGVRVRLFAAAAAVVGENEIEVPGVTTVGELIDRICEGRGDRVRRVLDQCSLLVDGERASSPAFRLAPGATVDVLPPFAGG